LHKYKGTKMEKRKILITNFGQENNFPIFFGKGVNSLLYVPFAVPEKSRDAYMTEVRGDEFLRKYKISSVHEVDNPERAVEDAQAIVIGGGNTHLLLKEMYDTNIVDLIREKVQNGMPIVGKSAGAGVLCPTIKTSNDWAIVDAPSLDAVNVVPFQINPHFQEFGTPGYQPRANKIGEFHTVCDTPVLGLIDGASLFVQGDSAILYGLKGAELFLQGELGREVKPKSRLDFLFE